MTNELDAPRALILRAIVIAVKRIPRESWAILLVFLHLVIAPCATAMMLMPPDADCEHCKASNSADACAVDSAATTSAMEAVAFDSGRAVQPVLAFPEVVSAWSPGTVTSDFWSDSSTTRHSGDPPLYLMLGQLRL